MPNNNFTVTVKDIAKLRSFSETRRGQAQIVALAILAATKDGKHPASKQAIVDLAAPKIDEYDATRTKGQGGQQGGSYVARYYVSDFSKSGALDVVRVAEGAEAPASNAKKTTKAA